MPLAVPCIYHTGKQHGVGLLLSLIALHCMTWKPNRFIRFTHILPERNSGLGQLHRLAECNTLQTRKLGCSLEILSLDCGQSFLEPTSHQLFTDVANPTDALSFWGPKATGALHELVGPRLMMVAIQDSRRRLLRVLGFRRFQLLLADLSRSVQKLMLTGSWHTRAEVLPSSRTCKLPTLFVSGFSPELRLH